MTTHHAIYTKNVTGPFEDLPLGRVIGFFQVLGDGPVIEHGYFGCRRVSVATARDIGVSAGHHPYDFSVWVSRDVPAAFVDEAVVIGAERNKVVEVGGAAVSPVDDVMYVNPTGAAASGVATALVPLADNADQPVWDGAGGAPDPDDSAGLIRDIDLKPGIADQAPRGFGEQRDAFFRLRPSLVIGERRQGDVNDSGGPVWVGICAS